MFAQLAPALRPVNAKEKFERQAPTSNTGPSQGIGGTGGEGQQGNKCLNMRGTGEQRQFLETRNTGNQ